MAPLAVAEGGGALDRFAAARRACTNLRDTGFCCRQPPGRHAPPQYPNRKPRDRANSLARSCRDRVLAARHSRRADGDRVETTRYGALAAIPVPVRPVTTADR